MGITNPLLFPLSYSHHKAARFRAHGYGRQTFELPHLPLEDKELPERLNLTLGLLRAYSEVTRKAEIPRTSRPKFHQRATVEAVAFGVPGHIELFLPLCLIVIGLYK